MVEIVSPDHPERDTEQKRREYAEAGIAEYWIVNPLNQLDRTITVWERTGDTWQTRNQFPFERSFNIGALPPHVVSGPRHLYVGMPNGTIHALDFASGQWQRHEAPFSLITLVTAGDVLYGYGATLTNSIWTSEDGGRTWRDLDTSRRAGAKPCFTAST